MNFVLDTTQPLQQQVKLLQDEQSLTEFDAILQQMDFGGLTLKQVIGGDSEYQLVTIELKKYFLAQADKFSSQIVDVQNTYSEQLRQANASADVLRDELKETTDLLNKERFERADAEQKRDAAASQLEEANSKIKQLQEAAAASTTKVVDTEEQERQKKELAAQIRRERTIYGKEALDFKRSKFKAYLASTGEEITFTNLEEPKYYEIKPEEVEQFREQYPAPAAQDDHADMALDPSAGGIEKLKTTFPDEGVQATETGLVADSNNGALLEGTGGQAEAPSLEERLTVLEDWKLSVEKWQREQGYTA